MEKITESPSPYNDLERMSTTELLGHINTEDRGVPEAVGRVLPEIAKLVEAIAERMRRGGRLFYLG
ncbi:MAG TPA: N-acetylmuramic acid 6-phosphate etherase, partial [Flavobacteriales bacterium]|nr:N-acetylmuramic acid 6-phosphate etherase [Flavobacteriales bacterium]